MQTNIVEKTAKYFKEKGVVLPTIDELKNPHTISEDIKNKVLIANQKKLGCDKKLSSKKPICAKGESHPPRNNKAVKAAINVILAYSARKNNPNAIPEYST